MESFPSFPTVTTGPASFYANTTVTAAPSSQQMFGLQFASQVSTTDNQQFHQMLQHHQALMLQQQQQQQQQQSQPVMYDHRRDSTSSMGGTSSRRTQSKAEKRAEHNAIERARREGLNTRFQQLAHLLPNLQHDTRPSKGTIIERTLEFVKDAIQKEDRYRHEIKDLRHTNRQLLKQLTHLTTGQNAQDNDAIDSDDQLSIRSPSPSIYALNNSDLSPLGGMSSLGSDTPLSSPTPIQQQRIQKRKQMNAPFIDNQHRMIPQNIQQIPSHNCQANTTSVKKIPDDQHPTSMQQTHSATSSSSVSALSDVWHHQLANSTWLQQSKTSHSPLSSSSSSTSFRSSSTSIHTTSTSPADSSDSSLVNVTHPSLSNPVLPSLSTQQHTYPTSLQDMKPFNFDGAMMKEEQLYHGLPDLFASYHQHHVAGYNTIQDTTRLSSRPASHPHFC